MIKLNFKMFFLEFNKESKKKAFYCFIEKINVVLRFN